MSIASQTAALVDAILDCGVAADTKTRARVAKAGDALTGALNFAPTVAGQADANNLLDLATVLSNTLTVTGVTGAVAALGTLPAGAKRTLIMMGGGTVLIHNAVSLILPTGANIVSQNGDTAEVVSLGGGNWRCVSYNRINGLPVGATALGLSVLTAADRAALLALVKSADQPTYRNLLINGNMEANQEQVGVGSGNGVYYVDGWTTSNTATSRITTQQSTNNPAAGHAFSLISTVVNAGAPAAADVYMHGQGLEGLNTRHLQWGSANPIAIAVSLLVRSSVPGTYGLTVRNFNATRSYVTPLVVNAANTWEAKSFIIPGDTAGTWPTTAVQSMSLGIVMASGSTYQTAATNAWQAGNFIAPAGQTQLTATNGATFQFTAVQAEPGWVSTFERLQLEATLRRAKRYWQSSYAYGSAPGTGNIVDAVRGFAINGNDIIPVAPFPVEMMAAPAVVLYNANTGAISNIRRISTGDGVGLSAGMSAGARSMYAAQAAGSLFVNELYDFHYIANKRI
jgi:hypothetical protein